MSLMNSTTVNHSEIIYITFHLCFQSFRISCSTVLKDFLAQTLFGGGETLFSVYMQGRAYRN